MRFRISHNAFVNGELIRVDEGPVVRDFQSDLDHNFISVTWEPLDDEARAAQAALGRGKRAALFTPTTGGLPRPGTQAQAPANTMSELGAKGEIKPVTAPTSANDEATILREQLRAAREKISILTAEAAAKTAAAAAEAEAAAKKAATPAPAPTPVPSTVENDATQTKAAGKAK